MQSILCECVITEPDCTYLMIKKSNLPNNNFTRLNVAKNPEIRSTSLTISSSPMPRPPSQLAWWETNQLVLAITPSSPRDYSFKLFLFAIWLINSSLFCTRSSVKSFYSLHQCSEYLSFNYYLFTGVALHYTHIIKKIRRRVWKK